ncbi:MAG: type II toxin-antitoxin system Phd/YefM family antitoxin [Puniceicoccales bacterium]
MEATYTETRSNFAKLWDQVVDQREPLTIHRRGSEDVVLLPASELSSLQETAHLLRSPKNAQRLLQALTASFEQQGESMSPGALKSELGLDA